MVGRPTEILHFFLGYVYGMGETNPHFPIVQVKITPTGPTGGT